MKSKILILSAILIGIVSCTSNTMYEKPKDLIPKDSMVALLTDMYIASSAKSVKNKFLKIEKNYTVLVYEKYKIDSTRFDISNVYYTSKIEEYTDMLRRVRKNIDSLQNFYKKEQAIQDSIQGKKVLEGFTDEILKEKAIDEKFLELKKIENK